MEVKILHMADVHLGRRFGYLGDRASEHQERVGRTFRRACEVAKEQGCHLILIAGDLFDSPRVERRWVRYALETLSGTGLPTYLIPGNHDPALDHPLLNESLPANLHFIPTCGGQPVPDLDLQLITCPPEAKKEWGSVLKRDPQGPPFQVALVHGSLPTQGSEGDLTPQQIAESDLDYIALGDWHSPKDCSAGGTLAWYSGAPEMVMPDQQLPGQVLIATLSDRPRGALRQGKQGNPPEGESVQTCPVGECVFPEGKPRLEIEVTPFPDWSSLLQAIRTRLTSTSVVNLRLTGRWRSPEPLDLIELEQELAASCLYLRLSAELLPQALEPETPFEKAFAALVERQSAPPQQDLYREALNLGLYLLRGGRL